MVKQPRLWRQRSFCCTDWSGGHAVQSSALRLVSTAIIVAGLYYDQCHSYLVALAFFLGFVLDPLVVAKSTGHSDHWPDYR
jgi:hypothetical protein